MSVKPVFRPTAFIQTGEQNAPLFEAQPLIKNTENLAQRYGFYEIGLDEKSPRLPSPRLLLTPAESAHENPCLQSIAEVIKRFFSCCDPSEFCCKTVPDLFSAQYEIDEDDNSSWEERSEEIESCF